MKNPTLLGNWEGNRRESPKSRQCVGVVGLKRRRFN